jgi:hypothetical protein
MNRIAVLGTGPSIHEFDPDGYDWSIGVNDIWKFYHSEDIVCLNAPKEFTPERLRIIQNSTPNKFFSQMVIWDTRPDFSKIDIRPGYPDRVCSIDRFGGYEKSFCSPFIAAQIAYRYYAAREIHLFGVDLTAHPKLDRALCGRIKVHFENLQAALIPKYSRLIVHGQGILKDL